MRQPVPPATFLHDTVVVIPSKRPPPIKTLESYPMITQFPVIVIADPRVKDAHLSWLLSRPDLPNVSVVLGRVGMIPQSAECYRQSFYAGYKFFFRMDDDLHDKTFVTAAQGHYPSAVEAMHAARTCAHVLNVTLAGFMNTSRRDWLGKGVKKTYGLIHGGAHLCCSAEDPSPFIDESLPAYEDVYRSAAHRAYDGAVGRVAYMGLDKRASLRDSSMSKTPEVQAEAKRIILGRFPKIVTCKGTRTLDGGRQTIPNWKLVRGDHWRP